MFWCKKFISKKVVLPIMVSPFHHIIGAAVNYRLKSGPTNSIHYAVDLGPAKKLALCHSWLSDFLASRSCSYIASDGKDGLEVEKIEG